MVVRPDLFLRLLGLDRLPGREGGVVLGRFFGGYGGGRQRQQEVGFPIDLGEKTGSSFDPLYGRNQI
jgi:hypothetical protein